MATVRFDPNVDLIVFLLAILKAVFSYLPKAPDWPGERIEYLLEDVQPLAIIANKDDYKNVLQKSYNLNHLKRLAMMIETKSRKI